MEHLKKFKDENVLFDRYKINDAHLIWVIGLYLDTPELEDLAEECLTDGANDHKIDFIKLDTYSKKILFAQGYYSEKIAKGAPSNKAADLNTAAAWLISGDIEHFPDRLKSIVKQCRAAISADEIEEIELLYVHNLNESEEVKKELETVVNHLRVSLNNPAIEVKAAELGLTEVESIYKEQFMEIAVDEKIDCPSKAQFNQSGDDWEAVVVSIRGDWLRELYVKYGQKLFSANYRGFLGISKRKKINNAIKNTAEKNSQSFWAYNNGITILTKAFVAHDDSLTLHGVSIINGAQTTGSIGSLENIGSLKDVKILAKIIACSATDRIKEIIKYNNTQNKITTWDKFSNDVQQKRIVREAESFGISYSLKRGFGDGKAELGIESVVQPLLAFHGNYTDSNRGKNSIFENDSAYRGAFENSKFQHILFVYTLVRAFEERRAILKTKNATGKITKEEERQYYLSRNLRFKYFFLAILGASIGTLLDKNLNTKEIGFNSQKLCEKSFLMDDTIKKLLPIIQMVQGILTTHLDDKTFNEEVSDTEYFIKMKEKVNQNLNAMLALLPDDKSLRTFRELVLG